MRRNYTKRSVYKASKKNRKRNTSSQRHREYLTRQRRKAARKKAKVEKQRLQHMQASTCRGFFVIFARYIVERLKLREHLEKHIYFHKGHNSTYSVVDMVIGLVGLMALGLPRVSDVGKYKEERLIAKALAMEKMFSATTAYRFLCKFGSLTFCRMLQKANARLLGDVLSDDKIITVDGDAATLRSYENEKEGAVKGYNKLRPGRPCFQGIAYFANDFCIASEAVAGNQVPIKSFNLLDDLKRVRRLLGRIDWIRLDGGYVSELNLQGLDNFSRYRNSRHKVDFVFSVGAKGVGYQEAMRLACLRPWQHVHKGVYVQDFHNIQVFDGYEKLHRIVLVKKFCTRTREYQYYALVTNNTQLDAKAIYRFYHKRQCIENFFNEAKNSYFLEHFPCAKLLGNSLFFNLISLTFNLVALFRFDTLRVQDSYCQAKTLRKIYFSVNMLWDGFVLTIYRYYPGYRIFLAILSRLQKLNIYITYVLSG